MSGRVVYAVLVLSRSSCEAAVDRRALLQLILFVLGLSVEALPVCLSPTSSGLCKSLRNPRDRPPAVPALQRLEVP